MSITDELREYFGKSKGMFTDHVLAIADRIDAEHEAKVAYWQGASYKDGYDEGFASADDWLEQHEDAMAEHGWIRLPKDADGEVIHIGDVMERGEARGSVIALMLSNYPKKWGGALHWGIQLDGEHAPTALDLMFHHYHAPTVEDVLREFVDEMNQNLGMYTGEAIDADEWRDADNKTIAKYAKRLTLAGDAE